MEHLFASLPYPAIQTYLSLGFENESRLRFAMVKVPRSSATSVPESPNPVSRWTFCSRPKRFGRAVGGACLLTLGIRQSRPQCPTQRPFEGKGGWPEKSSWSAKTDAMAEGVTNTFLAEWSGKEEGVCHWSHQQPRRSRRCHTVTFAIATGLFKGAKQLPHLIVHLCEVSGRDIKNRIAKAQQML